MGVTMSSGSSGHSVTVPEPLCSILFLIRRILGAVGWPSTRSRQEIAIKSGRLMLSDGGLLSLQRPGGLRLKGDPQKAPNCH